MAGLLSVLPWKDALLAVTAMAAVAVAVREVRILFHAKSAAKQQEDAQDTLVRSISQAEVSCLRPA